MSATFRGFPCVAIVGGGVAGLTAARMLKQEGIPFVLYESQNNVGGVWSKGYSRFSIQTTGAVYEFPDKELPNPKDYKEGSEIQKYCTEYVNDHDLAKHIRLETQVVAITKQQEDKWEVTSVLGKNGVEERQTFDFIILATGVYSPALKHIPKLEGSEYFKGKIMHSVDFHTNGAYGKKVLVVGFGKSAHDCAMNALNDTGVKPLLLFRRAHWCVPRKIVGLIPMEWLLYSRFGQGTLPRWQFCGPIEYFFHTVLKPLIWLYWRIVELILVFQLGLWGNGSYLRPTIAIEDDMYCGNGLIVHPDLFPLLHSGNMEARCGSIRCIDANGSINLTDGTTITADEIVYATGYQQAHSFLPKELLAKKEKDGFFAYRQMIVPEVPNIAFLNSNVTTFSNITTPTIQMAWIIALLQGKMKLPNNMADVVDQEKKWRREHLMYAKETSRAQYIQLHQIRYWDTLLSDVGINIKRKRSSIPFVGTAFKNFFEPLTSSDYKDVVTGEWRKDPTQICKPGYTPSFLKEWCVITAVFTLFLWQN